jgi:protein subunit release factor A
MKYEIIVTPAEGGEDSTLFAQDLLKAYMKFAAGRGFRY